ncbi:retrovirus-related pol polyprotein from transposon TNT 1-94, partial [Tanacetum coccineum]
SYYQAPKSHKPYAPTSKQSSSTRSNASTKFKGKEIAKLITPPSESASKEDSDPKQAQRDKDINKNVDTTPRNKNDNQTRQFGNQRTMTVVGARETVGSQVVQQTGIQCFNCKEVGHFAKECRKPKRVKDSTYHKEKMLLCKQAEKVVPLQAKQADWLEDTDEEIDEQEEEAHYSFMAKIQEVPTTNSRTDTEPLEHNLGESIGIRIVGLVALQNKRKQYEFERYKAFNDRTVDYDKLERRLNETLGLLAQKDIDIKECLKVKAYEISVVKEKHDELVKQSLLTKSHYEGLVKEKTKLESACRLKYVESLEDELDELESDKAEFSNMYDMLLQECVSKDVMCSYLQSSSDLDEITELQCLYLYKVRECDCLAQKLSEQTEFGRMPTKIELTLEQSQQGVSNDVLDLHKDGDGDASFQLESDSLPHAHAQTTKTFHKHQDSKIMKAQELKTKTSAQTLILKITPQKSSFEGDC